MLQAAYHCTPSELLVDGGRDDYNTFASAVHQSITTGVEVKLPVESVGPIRVACFIVRRGSPPNRVSYSDSAVVFAIATTLQAQFLSFIEFPADADLSDVLVQYHHHYEPVGAEGAYIASNSLPVVFSLKRCGE